MRMAARLQAMKHPSYVGTTRKSGNRQVWTGKVKLIEEALSVPRKWKKPRKIFVNSMSDLFQDGINPDFIERVWETMLAADHHVYQILTKRPDNMLRVVMERKLEFAPHIWLGTSVENAQYATRIDDLRKVPASVRFVSFEPLLGPVGSVDLTTVHWAIVGGEFRAKLKAHRTVMGRRNQVELQKIWHCIFL